MDKQEWIHVIYNWNWSSRKKQHNTFAKANLLRSSSFLKLPCYYSFLKIWLYEDDRIQWASSVRKQTLSPVRKRLSVHKEGAVNQSHRTVTTSRVVTPPSLPLYIQWLGDSNATLTSIPMVRNIITSVVLWLVTFIVLVFVFC